MTDALRAVPGGLRVEAGSAANGDAIGGAQLLFVDMRFRSLLVRHARQTAVTRVFGVPAEDQSFLVRAILIGAAGTVVWGLVPRPWHRPSGADAEIGGLLLNAAFRGLAGAPSRNMPIGGALIALAVLSHSLRPAVAGSAREMHALERYFRHAFGARYGHHHIESE
jgi:hypothetical protein